VQFISFPVTAGFVSAAAITIASSQLKGLLGIKGSGNEFLESWENLFNNIQDTRPGDVTLGVCTILLLLIGKVQYLMHKHFDTSGGIGVN
jgi:Sulfate permease and related transporters (MFS superfamily)